MRILTSWHIAIFFGWFLELPKKRIIIDPRTLYLSPKYFKTYKKIWKHLWTYYFHGWEYDFLKCLEGPCTFFEIWQLVFGHLKICKFEFGQLKFGKLETWRCDKFETLKFKHLNFWEFDNLKIGNCDCSFWIFWASHVLSNCVKMGIG